MKALPSSQIPRACISRYLWQDFPQSSVPARRVIVQRTKDCPAIGTHFRTYEPPRETLRSLYPNSFAPVDSGLRHFANTALSYGGRLVPVPASFRTKLATLRSSGVPDRLLASPSRPRFAAALSTLEKLDVFHIAATMKTFYLGIVERISLGKPGARVRPIAQASTDKAAWNITNEKFDNSGVVSWWTIPKDLRKGSYWIFQIEESPSYQADKPQHDEFRIVENSSHPATQVLTLPAAKDEDDIRRLLIADGLPVDRCVTKQAFVSTFAGNYIGPFRLVFGNEKVTLDPSDLEAPVDVYELVKPKEFFTHDDYAILPAAAMLTIFKKVGEVDFSPDSVFLKRAIRDLKKAEPNTIETAKLTSRLIDTYIHAFGTKHLSLAERHRLARLKSLAESGKGDIQLVEDCLSALAAWAPVQQQIETAKEQAVSRALLDQKGAIDDLTQTNHHLEDKRKALVSELKTLDERALAQRRENETALEEFEKSVRRKLKAVATESTEFLASIPLIKAALGAFDGAKTGGKETASIRTAISNAGIAARDQVVPTLQANVSAAGLDWWTAAALASSLTAGFVPLVRGHQTRDQLNVIAASLTGSRLFWLPLNPTQLTSVDLSNAIVTCDDPAYDGNTITLKSLLRHVRETGQLCLLCFEGINLCQADALLMPVLRQYAHLRKIVSVGTDVRPDIMTALGPWPNNLLIAGTIVESPLALPMSKAVWELATMVSAPLVFKPSLPQYKKAAESSPSVTSVDSSEWTAFIREIGKGAIQPHAMNSVAWDG